MKNIELHAHYFRQLVQTKVISLLYCRTDDQVDDIFINPLSKVKFLKFPCLLGLQSTTIVGGCANVISPPKSPKCHVDGEVLGPLIMLVQHTFWYFGDNRSNSRLDGRVEQDSRRAHKIVVDWIDEAMIDWDGRQANETLWVFWKHLEPSIIICGADLPLFEEAF